MSLQTAKALRSDDAVNYLIIISVAVGGVLLYLLSSSGANTEVFSVNYYGLLGLTGLLSLGLMALVGYQLWHLRIKLKNRILAPDSRCAWWSFSR